MNEFVIDFVYEQKRFSGLVIPMQQGSEIVYTVKAESQDQELNLDVIANPCGDGKMEWCFSGMSDEAQRYDRAFLQEIGEAIEKYETSGQ
jgi:hypothetical protein